ncbi:unnamed protein product [Arabidopsis halleri]
MMPNAVAKGKSCCSLIRFNTFIRRNDEIFLFLKNL